jgi:leucyl/phenylalanyl-tRNA--protein transferase
MFMTIDIRVKQAGTLFSAGIEATPLPSLRQARASRADRFRESPAALLARHALGALGYFQDNGLAAALGMVRAALTPAKTTALPDARRTGEDGFCGQAAEISPERLLEAAGHGLQPRGDLGPANWWSPVTRDVLWLEDFRTPKRVRGHLRRRSLSVTFDRNFDLVIATCRSDPERPATWLSPRLMHAYAALHDLGCAHSFEVRDELGSLVAGGFGVAVGRSFVLCATFGSAQHFSDLGLTVLARHLTAWNFTMLEGLEGPRPDLGFTSMDRDRYLECLAAESAGGRAGRWQVDRALCQPGLPGPAQSSELPLRQAA